MSIEIDSSVSFGHAETIRDAGGSTVGVVPWHNISAKAPAREFADGHDLARELGLAWRVDPGPLQRPDPGHSREGYYNPGNIPNFRGVFRGDNGTCLGTVGRGWHAIQNHQLCDIAVSLSRIMPIRIDGGGILGEGEKVWVMADLGTRQIGNRVLRSGEPDAVNQYVLFVTAHNGKGAAKVIPVPNQMSCANALAGIIQSKGKFGWSIAHTLNADKRLAAAKRGLFEATRWFNGLFDELEKLETQPFTHRQMAAYADKFIEELRGTVESAKEITERAKDAREDDKIDLVRLFDEGASNIGRTKVDALNAVTEFISHHRRRAKKGGDETRAALSRLEDEWYGSHAIKMRRRALNILQTI